MKPVRGTEITRKFWRHLSQDDWDSAATLLSPDIEVHLPKSETTLKGLENAKAHYADLCGQKLQVQQDLQHLDRWSFAEHVVTEVRVDLPTGPLYLVTFFEIEEEESVEIREIREYRV